MAKEVVNQDDAEKEPKSSVVESKYKVAELAKASNRFQVPRECVEAAFKVAGKAEATLVEAEKIIKDFMKREVK